MIKRETWVKIILVLAVLMIDLFTSLVSPENEVNSIVTNFGFKGWIFVFVFNILIIPFLIVGKRDIFDPIVWFIALHGLGILSNIAIGTYQMTLPNFAIRTFGLLITITESILFTLLIIEMFKNVRIITTERGRKLCEN
jgi:hypothetical protein